MPGPNSAPNGDRRLTTNGRLRSDLRDQGKLSTGKTEKDEESGKWARHLQNRRARSEMKIVPGKKR